MTTPTTRRRRMATLAVLGAAAGTAFLGAPAHAADLCPLDPDEGVVCVDQRNDLAQPVEPGSTISGYYEMATRGTPRTIATSDIKLPFGLACSAKGAVTNSITLTFDDVPGSYAEGLLRIAKDTTMPDVCNSKTVFVRTAGPVSGTVVADNMSRMSLWVGFAGGGEGSTSVGGCCVDPGPLSGVSQVPGLGSLAPFGVAGLFFATLATVGLRRKAHAAAQPVARAAAPTGPGPARH